MNKSLRCAITAFASLGLIAAKLNAGQTNVTAYTSAQIDSFTSAATDVNEGAPQNYLKVKARASVTTTIASKSYIAFDVTGKSANTNINATLSLRRTANSGQQHIQLWALNQAFPAMNTNLMWGSNTNLAPTNIVAQANDEISNDMLTNGIHTATSLADQLVNGGNATDDFVITAPWGKYVFNGKLVFAVTGIPDANSPSGSAGYRITNDTTLPVLNFNDTLGNQPPTITSISNLTIYSHVTSAPLAFAVADDSTSAASINVVATTSDSTVVTTNFVFTGQGTSSNRTVQLLAGLGGTATVTLTADDGTATNFTVFTVTVLANPTITTPSWTNTIGTNPVTSTFTVGDALFPVTSITNAGTCRNTNLINAANIVVSGTTSNRTATVTANSGQDGVAVINLTAGDSNGTTTVSYPVMVLPNPNTYFSDHFDYTDGVLDSHSAFLWTQRVVAAVSIRANTSHAIVRATSSGESLIAPLVGAPYSSGVIYVGFNATWTNMPTAANGWFVHLHDRPNALPLGRIYAMTNATDTNIFQLGVACGAGPVVNTNVTLQLNTPYRVVMAYDIAGGTFGPSLFTAARLWVNQTNESVLYAQANDSAALGALTHIGLRQTTGIGDILIDDLKVGSSFAQVLPPAVVVLTTPVITASSLLSATNFGINFTGSPNDLATDFAVTRSSIVNGTYTTVVTNAVISTPSPGVFNATVPVSGTVNFYKIRR